MVFKNTGNALWEFRREEEGGKHSNDISEDGSEKHKGKTPSEILEGGSRKPRKYQAKKKEINIEGKMVADGVYASQGQFDDDVGDWKPAVSRSTQRRFLRRKARREYNEALSSQDQQELEEIIDDSADEDTRASNQLVHSQ
ncbi:hypothetical protein RIF29_34395 [Crotalaria pallida]|uniref:Uncharacterized protein n=1 Tax=Crotalaria pallida TaxID=3830 RepID=A0AAN9HR82_CROPI